MNVKTLFSVLIQIMTMISIVPNTITLRKMRFKSSALIVCYLLSILPSLCIPVCAVRAFRNAEGDNFKEVLCTKKLCGIIPLR